MYKKRSYYISDMANMLNHEKPFYTIYKKVLDFLRKQSSSNDTLNKTTYQLIIGGEWNTVFENDDQFLDFCKKIIRSILCSIAIDFVTLHLK